MGKYIRHIKIFTRISIIIVIILNLIVYFFQINTTESIPIGIYYRKLNPDIKIGDYVVFPIEERYKKFIKEDEEFKDINSFIKPVSAKEGDYIKMIDDNVYINNKFITKRYKLTGLDNPNIDRILKKDEFFLISKNIYSFDSRYLGIINKKDIIGHYKYLTDLNIKNIREYNIKIFGKNYKEGVELR